MVFNSCLQGPLTRINIPLQKCIEIAFLQVIFGIVVSDIFAFEC